MHRVIQQLYNCFTCALLWLSRTCRVWKCLTLAPRWRQYRKSVAYGSSTSGLHIGRHSRKCIEYRCIWSGRQYCTIVIKLRSRTPTLDKRMPRSRSWIFLPARAWDIILGSGRERARAKKSSSLHSGSLGSLNWNETGSDLLCVRRWAVSWVTDYFFIQFYVSTIFHNDWTPEMKRWKERLCIILTVFNWHSTSVSSTECNTELNTICTVRDATRWIGWKVQHEVFNSTRRGEWKLNTDCI